MQVSPVQTPGAPAEAKYGIGVSFKPDEKKYLEVRLDNVIVMAANTC